MRKRLLAVLMTSVMMLSLLALQGNALKREGNNVSLTFSATTAQCYGHCQGSSGDTLSATLSLYRGSILIDSWSDSGTGSLTLYGTHVVTHGAKCRVEMTYSINGVAQTPVTETGTCP